MKGILTQPSRWITRVWSSLLVLALAVSSLSLTSCTTEEGVVAGALAGAVLGGVVGHNSEKRYKRGSRRYHDDRYYDRGRRSHGYDDHGYGRRGSSRNYYPSSYGSASYGGDRCYNDGYGYY